MYRKTATTIAALALVTAMALPAQLLGQSEPAAVTNSDSRVTVNVENGNWLDVRVYALRENGAYSRIGTVTSFSKKSFELPRWVASSMVEVRLVAAPIGSTQIYAAPPVVVSAGDVIEMKVANNLDLSSVMVQAPYTGR